LLNAIFVFDIFFWLFAIVGFIGIILFMTPAVHDFVLVESAVLFTGGVLMVVLMKTNSLAENSPKKKRCPFW